MKSFSTTWRVFVLGLLLCGGLAYARGKASYVFVVDSLRGKVVLYQCEDFFSDLDKRRGEEFRKVRLNFAGRKEVASAVFTDPEYLKAAESLTLDKFFHIPALVVSVDGVVPFHVLVKGFTYSGEDQPAKGYGFWQQARFWGQQEAEDAAVLRNFDVFRRGVQHLSYSYAFQNIVAAGKGEKGRPSGDVVQDFNDVHAELVPFQGVSALMWMHRFQCISFEARNAYGGGGTEGYAPVSVAIPFGLLTPGSDVPGITRRLLSGAGVVMVVSKRKVQWDIACAGVVDNRFVGWSYDNTPVDYPDGVTVQCVDKTARRGIAVGWPLRDDKGEVQTIGRYFRMGRDLPVEKGTQAEKRRQNRVVALKDGTAPVVAERMSKDGEKEFLTAKYARAVLGFYGDEWASMNSDHPSLTLSTFKARDETVVWVKCSEDFATGQIR